MKEQASNTRSWIEVDEKLRSIAGAKAHISKYQAEMNERILAIQKEYFEKTTEQRELIETTGQEILMFVKGRSEEFAKKKTRKLVFGEVSIKRTAPSLATVEGLELKDVLSRLKRCGMESYIRTFEEVSLDEIKANITDAKDLARLGLYLKSDENITYKTYEVDIEATEPVSLLPK